MNSDSLPMHVGIIMDGNRRWALKKGLSFCEGHKEGLRRAKEIIEHSVKLGIKYLSLYVFSTENWNRTKSEVEYLMFLIADYLSAEFEFYSVNNIKLLVSGDIEDLSKEVRDSVIGAISFTRNFDGLVLNLAINYGGRNEIVRASKKILESGLSFDALNEITFSKFLDNPELCDLDLLIRTGGDMRVSNFLLWRIAYCELVFSSTLWPEYSISHYESDLGCFKNRKRNFGR
ncbi:di-trans,poly-cis-decaprenylcistransferase [Borrelia anserina]|uniref:Isoprenyl transferase n=2 Tax=Borrelia anserina TaxID=143 RepID=W5SV76_BORAN|nr:polyprenyl diphosphate synthase [Borrelia anserina]AHH08082.1 Undecaprenyl pyrophosphate synthetase [Borrelia anserina BA2]AHH08911.1 Undecaprenyl pyrophosphate synthetase [Borrelia anserina BA2]APR64628.1 UDP diphosphate synthase [Borrelia anserina Es]UPA06541.1 di-trans,poly-cis-decaprenylcistransferase [Borrelia anserina]